MKQLPALTNSYLRVLAALVFSLSLYSLPASAELSDPYFSSSGSWKQEYADQWGMHTIGLLDPEDKKSAWAKETGESNQIIVAVIDTGLDYFHPDLDRATVWRNPNEWSNGLDDDGNGYVDDLIGWNFIDGDNNPWDLAGHGTHIAGIIGAKPNNEEGIAGINWGVKIMPLKVMNFVGRGRTVRLAEAIFYAVKNGAHIINLSLGAEHQSQIQREAIDYALENDVLVIVAAGNAGGDTVNFSPAGLDNVVTVAASTPDNKRAGFSNWGKAVDITAPGVEILSLRARRTDFALLAGVENYQAGEAFVGEQNKLYRASGTSFAAPFVTGVASLMLAKNPDLSALQLKRMLLQSAKDIDVGGVDQNTGYGLLDANAALSIDADFYNEAAIKGVQVVKVKGKTLVRVSGTADADKFSQATLEIGQGQTPAKWKKVGKSIKRPVKQDVLGDIPTKELRGAKTWTIRLISKHKNGKTREARFVLNLG